MPVSTTITVVFFTGTPFYEEKVVSKVGSD